MRAPEVPVPLQTDEAAKLFVSRCTGCHTIGRGALTGPDLAASRAWREPDLETAILRMQEKAGTLTRDDVASLIAFLKHEQVHERIGAEEARIAQQFAAKLAPPDAATGERLFRGIEPLAERGLACVACHRIGAVDGGTLGPDLTGISARMGEVGLVSAMEKSPFKVMTPLYREHPVSRQEAMHITRWITTVDTQTGASVSRAVDSAAAVVALCGLGVLLLSLRKSASSSARQSLERRSSR
jgi:cytochrome c2